MKIDTQCIHGNENNYDHTGAISVPIYQSATFVHKAVGVSTGFDYSRLQNPTREHLEKIIANLEVGFDAMAFSSGMAAISALMELFTLGDHIIASDDLYGGTYRLFTKISHKNGLEIDLVDTSHIDNIENKIKANTKAIYIESPTNPMMQITDINEVTVLAKKYKLLTIVDNTFLTPYFMQPITLGADIVIHSGTKYLCGHNDTLAGFVVVNNALLSEKLRFICKTTGACLAPFDSWLLIRGIKTLAVRMERQQQNAIILAQFLKSNKKIKAVHYAGLSDNAGYDISVRQGRGFGAMISFETITKETAIKILETVKVIQFAESLGGVESLITYPMMQTHADVPEAIREQKGINSRLLRLSVGIENIEDLIDDLTQAIG